MEDAVIVDAVRTPFGGHGGAFRDTHAQDLAAAPLRALESRNSGVPAAVEEGFHLLGKGGRYLVMGNIIPGNEATIDPGHVVRKSIEVVTTMRYAPARLNDALSFLLRYGDDYPFDDLVDASYPLSDVGRALRDSANREVTRATLVSE